MKEVVQQHSQQAAGASGLMPPPPPLLQGGEATARVQRQWRPAIPLGKAASLTRAMSITRSGSGRRALSAADTATSQGDMLTGALAPPPPLSPAAAAAAAAALANATSSGGGSDRSGGRLKKPLGRPIAFQGDPTGLTEAERRHIRRRELNRASARRVRAKASATLSELATRMAQMEQHNAALASQVATVEADRAALQQQVATMGQQLQAAAAETARLRQDQAAAQQALHQQYQAQYAQAMQQASTQAAGAAMSTAGAAMVTSGFNGPLRGPPPTINIARRGVTVTSAVPTSWSAQPQQHQHQHQQGQSPAAGSKPASADQYVPGVPLSVAQQPQTQPLAAQEQEQQDQQEQRQAMRTRRAAMQAQAAAQQREQLQQQQLRQQHPPIGGCQQPGGVSMPAVSFGPPVSFPSHFGGQQQQQQQFYSGGGGGGGYPSGAMGMPAIPGQQQAGAMSPQLHASPATLQKQAELRASLDGGFGTPLVAPGFSGGDPDMPPPQAGTWPAGGTASAAAMSMSSGIPGVPGSALAGLNPGGMAGPAGMPSMPSLSFLNNGELVGDGAGHVPLDFTMTQASLELLSLTEMMGTQPASQPDA